MDDMPERFTRAEAEALLPRLGPLLEGLRAMSQELAGGMARYEALRAKMRGNGHAHQGEFQALGVRLRELRGAMEARIREIAALGVLVKDPTSGLIDFPTLRDGRTVYLCWRLGEGERIRHWHEVDAGFAGRQPLGD